MTKFWVPQGVAETNNKQNQINFSRSNYMLFKIHPHIKYLSALQGNTENLKIYSTVEMKVFFLDTFNDFIKLLLYEIIYLGTGISK